MRLPDPRAPYASLLKWALIACLLIGPPAVAYIIGRSDGREAQARDDAKAIRESERYQDVMRRTLSANARTFRALDAIARANLKRAATERARAAEDDSQAAKTRGMLEQRVRALAAEAERERFTCSHAEMRICGSPLR